MNWFKAQTTMESARNKANGKPLQNNTRLYERPTPPECLGGYDEGTPSYAVRLHNTDVVTIHPDGTYTLEDGGYRTVTTKARINEYSPARIYQERFVWYFSDGTPASLPVRIGSDGLPLMQGESYAKEAATEEEAIQATRDAINEYIRGFAADALANGISEPSGGDCWACHFRDAKDRTAEPMGFSHYLSHFEEGYFPPSLLWNALLTAARGNEQSAATVWYMIQNGLSPRREGEKPSTDLLESRLRYFFSRPERRNAIEQAMKNRNAVEA